MTQREIDRNREAVIRNLTDRREAARVEAFNARLAAEEAEYRENIRRQMDAGYLFESINKGCGGKTPIKLYDAETGRLTSAGEQTEWWEEYPCLYSMAVGAGVILGMMIISQFVLGALGMI